MTSLNSFSIIILAVTTVILSFHISMISGRVDALTARVAVLEQADRP